MNDNELFSIDRLPTSFMWVIRWLTDEDEEDWARAQSRYGGDGGYMGVRVTLSAWGVNIEDSLWGIESDVKDEYKQEIIRECKRNCWAQLQDDLHEIIEANAKVALDLLALKRQMHTD